MTPNDVEKLGMLLKTGLYTPVELFLNYSYKLKLEKFIEIINQNYSKMVENVMDLQEIAYIYRQKRRILAELDINHPFRLNLQQELSLIKEQAVKAIRMLTDRYNPLDVLERFAELRTPEADSHLVDYRLTIEQKYKLWDKELNE